MEVKAFEPEFDRVTPIKGVTLKTSKPSSIGVVKRSEK